MNFLQSLINYFALALIFSPLLVQAADVETIHQVFLADKPLSSDAKLIDLPLTKDEISDMAINNSNFSLIGGYRTESDQQMKYAAFLSPEGNVYPINLSMETGSIVSVDINNSNSDLTGIISGIDEGYANSDCAIVSFADSQNPCKIAVPNEHIIFSVAINDSNQSIIGGQGKGYCYAGLIFPSAKEITPLDLDNAGGHINAVAINSFNQAIIGGITFNGPDDVFPYAAVVTISETSSSIKPLNFGSSGSILNVAVSDSNVAIIGGGQNMADTSHYSAYAAIVSNLDSAAPVITPLELNNMLGSIYSVAINNNAGAPMAIIGGSNGDQNSSSAYAAFVNADGLVIPIALPAPLNSKIWRVAINDLNYAVVAGETLKGIDVNGPTYSAYAAIISPLGEVKQLNFYPINLYPSNGSIYSAAIDKDGRAFLGGFQDYFSIMTQIPTEKLKGNSLAFANYINQYATQIPFHFTLPVIGDTLEAALKSATPTRNALTTYTASNNLFYFTSSLARQLHKQRSFIPSSNMSDSKKHSCWFEAVGVASCQKAQSQTGGFCPASGGGITGLELSIGKRGKIGVGASYLYTKIQEEHQAAWSHIQQEDLFFYGGFAKDLFYVDGSLLGGLFQARQARAISLEDYQASASSSPHGWQLLPHLELGFNFLQVKDSLKPQLLLNPFISLDWSHTWQNSYQEQGRGLFNIVQKAHHSSLLRTEASLRVSQTICTQRMSLTLQGKGGYVNTNSFNAGKIEASLVGSTGSFTVETLAAARHLAVTQLALAIEPFSSYVPACTFSYQGEYGPQYRSHQLNLQTAWNF